MRKHPQQIVLRLAGLEKQAFSLDDLKFWEEPDAGDYAKAGVGGVLASGAASVPVAMGQLGASEYMKQHGGRVFDNVEDGEALLEQLRQQHTPDVPFLRSNDVTEAPDAFLNASTMKKVRRADPGSLKETMFEMAGVPSNIQQQVRDLPEDVTRAITRSGDSALAPAAIHEMGHASRSFGKLPWKAYGLSRFGLHGGIGAALLGDDDVRDYAPLIPAAMAAPQLWEEARAWRQAHRFAEPVLDEAGQKALRRMGRGALSTYGLNVLPAMAGTWAAGKLMED